MTKTKPSGWSYYLPENGETKDDAVPIEIYDWQHGIIDAEHAAEEAGEDEWDNRDGWESGIDHEPLIVVISPDGEESRWKISREACVNHRAREAQEDD
jgi:hypothetical protein